MDLGKAGWFPALLREVVEGFSPAPVQDTDGPPGRARARRFLRRGLRDSGLLYGTPTGPQGPTPSTSPEEQLFLAVLRTFARLALEVAHRAGAADERRAEQLLVLFAALVGQVETAEEIALQLLEGKVPTRRHWSKVEGALVQRAISLSGDPVYGLVLHNGAVYVDGQLFGRLALGYFASGKLRPHVTGRMVEMAAREKVVLVEVLTALACAERPPGFAARRAVLRQIEDLCLPGKLEGELKARVKRAFERTPQVTAVVRPVRSAELKRFLLEQTLLASLVDGRRSPGELAFLTQLSEALGISAVERARYEVEVAEFYAQNRSVVDVFTVSAGAGRMGEELVESMQATVEKNFHRLLREVKEAGELSVLLAKAARGVSLTPEERRKMRVQLIDVAKVVPALAIFAAPGGMLLLIALAKVLPFNLLPSAFQDEPEPGRE